jgi:cobalamin biosynthesis Mg chelatase CobN
MGVMKRTGTLIAVLLAVLTAAPSAYADAFKDIYRSYRTSGTVDGCRWSAKQLADAKGQVPNDIQQYAPDFPAALSNAIQRRASGGCAGSAAAKPSAAAAPASSSAGSGGAAAAPTSAAPTASPGAAATAAAGQAPQPAATAKPAPAVVDNAVLAAARTRSSDAGMPAPLVALAVIGVLMALAALVYALARWWAWEPRWLARARHAGAEAGWRVSGSWAEFVDWVRLGR